MCISTKTFFEANAGATKAQIGQCRKRERKKNVIKCFHSNHFVWKLFYLILLPGEELIDQNWLQFSCNALQAFSSITFMFFLLHIWAPQVLWRIMSTSSSLNILWMKLEKRHGCCFYTVQTHLTYLTSRNHRSCLCQIHHYDVSKSTKLCTLFNHQ